MSVLSEVQADFKQIADKAWRWTIGLGLAGIVIGALALIWPGRTAPVLGVLFGVYLVVSGFFEVVLGVTAPLSVGVRILTLIGGVLSIALGVICFKDTTQSVALLGIWIGIGWIAAGIAAIAAGASFDGQNKGWVIFEGILLIIGGIILILSPITSLVALAIVTGSFLVVIGIVQVIRGFQMRKAVNG